MRHRFAILLFLFAFCSIPSFGMHIIGGDFTYTCGGEVSPGVKRYTFKLTVYRDCASGGANFDQQASIGIYRGDQQSAVLFDDFFAPGAMTVPLPPDTPACVTQFPNVCVQSKTYTFTRDLPVANESYFIVYQRCCRNNTIKNLINPGQTGVTYFAEVTPAAQTVCNNSPTFNNFPRSVICNNIPLIEDQSASDTEGDQLVYSFCSPLDGGGYILNGPGANGCDGVNPQPSCGPPFDNVAFLAPTYTPSAPMGGNPVISINPSTGIITGTPNQLGQFVVGVCVQEFRNGMLLSTLRRDFQFNLADCAPDVIADIVADTIVGPQVYEIQSCGNKTVFIKNKSKLGTPPADIEWRFDLKSSVFTSTDTDVTVNFPDTGLYRGVMYLNPSEVCNDSAEIFVRIFPEITADFDYDYDTCVAGPVSFIDLTTSDGGVNKWEWQFDVTGGLSTQKSPDHTYAVPGVKQVSLRARDKNGCEDLITKTILYQPAPPYLIVQPNKFLECAPSTIFFTNLSTPIDSTYFVTWDYGDGSRDSGIISPAHQYEKEGFYSVSLFIRSPIGCEVSDTFTNLIRMVPAPVADFEMDPSTGLNQNNRTVQFTDKSIDAVRWGWKFGDVQTSIQQNPVYTFPDTGYTQVLLVVTHPEGCKDTISKWLDIVPVVKYTMPNAFTPNGDSDNETFIGNGLMNYASDFTMSIWNRYGEQVFNTDHPAKGWNGTIRNDGKICPDGIYVYLVSYKDSRGETYEQKGYLNLIR